MATSRSMSRCTHGRCQKADTLSRRTVQVSYLDNYDKLVLTWFYKAPGDIILGPPRTSFTSSSALKLTPSDSPNRSAFGSFGADGRVDYSSRGKTGGERGKHDAREEKLRDARSSSYKGGRVEFLHWSNRSGKNAGTDDVPAHGDFGSLNLEPDFGEALRKSSTRGFDAIRRDGSDNLDDSKRPTSHRVARSLWFRDEGPAGTTAQDPGTDNPRARDWRESERNKGKPERDWARGVKAEEEPEWMGDAKFEQRKDGYNAQDIEQWKASMKARDIGPSSSDITRTAHSHTKSDSLSDRVKEDSPLSVDPTLDRFLSFFGDSGVGEQSHEVGVAHSNLKPREHRANQKSSKFTGFFGPQATPAPMGPEQIATAIEPTASTPSDEASEDKAGFERILQMLGVPQPSISSRTEKTPWSNNQKVFHTDNEPQLGFTTNPSPPILSPRSRKTHDLEGLLGLQSPKEGSASMSKDSEFLLNLLRPKDQGLARGPQGGRDRLHEKPADVVSQEILPDVHYSIAHRAADPDFRHRRYPKETDFVNSRLQGKPLPITHDAISRYRSLQFDESDESSVFPPQFAVGVPSQQFPPGLQRPSGFDQPAPPPGFPHFLAQQQHQNPRAPGLVGPPPGFGVSPSRGTNAQQPPPGLLHDMNGSGMNERGSFDSRPVGHGGSNGPLPPPGFGIGVPPAHVFPFMPSIGPEAFFGGRGAQSEFSENAYYVNSRDGTSTGHLRRH